MRRPVALNACRPRGLRAPLAAAVLALCGGAAQALTFSFNFTTPVTAQQLAPIQAAANYWSAAITTNTTVVLDIGFANLGSNVLGETGSGIVNVNYSSLRSALIASSSSAVDASAYSHLAAGPTVSFWSTQMDGSSRFNNDTSAASCGTGVCDTDNRTWQLTSANAKALGLYNGAGSDAQMTFSTAFAFDYDRSNGITPNTIDLQTVALHEIGHALGFVSGVDDADYCLADSTCATFAAALEQNPHYAALDLFRYSAASPTQLDLRVGGDAYFSIDGGLTRVANFATGENFGDGWQASHFGTNRVSLMRPYVGWAEAYDAYGEDLTAMDVIGWSLASAVPEPASWGLMALGLAGLGLRARRRRQG